MMLSFFFAVSEIIVRLSNIILSCALLVSGIEGWYIGILFAICEFCERSCGISAVLAVQMPSVSPLRKFQK